MPYLVELVLSNRDEDRRVATTPSVERTAGADESRLLSHEDGGNFQSAAPKSSIRPVWPMPSAMAAIRMICCFIWMTL